MFARCPPGGQGLIPHDRHGFGDARADYVHAQEFVGFFVGQHFHEAKQAHGRPQTQLSRGKSDYQVVKSKNSGAKCFGRNKPYTTSLCDLLKANYLPKRLYLAACFCPTP
ncbi:hypothetical protein [Hymenobacter busanensis]|uniref:hypothetical protein n=1 Tax=Hymenobacter busanensis TaxID=2607656 RepID=UPI003B84880A